MNNLARSLSVTLAACLLWPAAAIASAPAVTLAEDNRAAVIFVYQRVGEPTTPDISISTDKFMAHLEEIQNGHYNVISLPDLVTALKRGDTLPPRTIAITFEGAFKSALDNAVPALIENEIPFTVFYSSDYADADSSTHMNWSDLISLAAYPTVTLGLLPASFARLKDLPESEIRRQVNKAKTRHREMIESEAKFFSYPYGEYSAAYKKIVASSGFDAAFGQQSGAVSSVSDLYAIPRFTLTDEYGDTERFKTAAETLPLPATDIEPQNTVLSGDQPIIGFSVPAALKTSLGALSCFATGQSAPNINVINNRVEIRPQGKPGTDRLRVNCTLPGPNNPEDDSARWRWIGFIFSGEGVEAEGDDTPDEISTQQQSALP